MDGVTKEEAEEIINKLEALLNAVGEPSFIALAVGNDYFSVKNDAAKNLPVIESHNIAAGIVKVVSLNLIT